MRIPNRNNAHSIFLLLLIFATLFFHQTVNANASLIESNSTNTTNNFILKNCESTYYPNLCYSSLSQYANYIQQNSIIMARVAVLFSQSKAEVMASFIFNIPLNNNYTLDSIVMSNLRECFNNVGDAINEIRSSMKQMRTIALGGATKAQVSNVVTWMSQAVANEDKCIHRFRNIIDDDDDDVNKQVYDRMTYLKMVTSNALALINAYYANNKE